MLISHDATDVCVVDTADAMLAVALYFCCVLCGCAVFPCAFAFAFWLCLLPLPSAFAFAFWLCLLALPVAFASCYLWLMLADYYE